MKNANRLTLNPLTKELKLFRWVCLSLLVSSSSAFGQQPTSAEERLAVLSQDQVEPLNKPIENQIQMASKLLNTELKKDDASVGRIQGLAFDLETEHLAVLIAMRSEAGKEAEWTMLPFVPGDRLVKFGWEKKTTLTTSPMSLTRSQAHEVYRLYKEAVYWIDFATRMESEKGRKFDDQNFHLSLFSSLMKLPIADDQGKVVGQIHDVAIKASNGSIQYVVVQTDDHKMRAIPLGAFVSDEDNKRWFIELNSDQILKFKPFAENAPPSQIDTGWKEYVAVRYGRGGIQSRKKVK